MPVNKKILTMVRKVFYDNNNLKDSYESERRLVEFSHPYVLKKFCKTYDYFIPSEYYKIPVRFFLPFIDGNYPLIIYIHGGGFVTGNVQSYSTLCTRIANKTKHIVASIEYRLAPEHKFPIGLEDCYAAVKSLTSEALLFSSNKDKVILMGDSAGANLVAAISLLALERGDFKVDKQILLYPALYNDYSESSPFASVVENGEDYLLTKERMTSYLELYTTSKEDLDNKYLAPLLAEDLSSQPDTLIISAQYDLLRDEAKEYANKLKEAGSTSWYHEIQDVVHGFFMLSPMLEPVKKSYEIINEFLNTEDSMKKTDIIEEIMDIERKTTIKGNKSIEGE